MKHTILYSILCAMLALLWACDKECNNTLSSGSEALRIQVMQLGYTEEDGKTRATTDGLGITAFELGDEIGIFAIKNGVVLDDCKNVKLTMQADGSWGGNTVYFSTGATYFAYSPYRDVAGINSAKSTADIYNNFTLSYNLSNKDLFTANDLMTSTICTADKESKSLTITFEHRFALVEIEYAHCKSISTGLKYQLSGATASKLHLVDGGSTVVSGYRPSFSSSLKRFLLKPSTACNIACIYEYPLKTSGSGYATYAIPTALNFEGGRRYKLNPYQMRDVKVFDYYYSDGSIYPKEWTDAGGAPPDINKGCIGVVFALGSTGIANGDNVSNYDGKLTGGINGYVLAAKCTDLLHYATWGPKGVTVGTSTSTTDFLGYSNTKKITRMPGYSESTYQACWRVCNYPVTTPSNSSGWFLASIGQLNVLNGIDPLSGVTFASDMAKYLESVGGDDFVFEYVGLYFYEDFFSSTEGDKDYAWGIKLYNYSGKYEKSYAGLLARSCLAF